MKILTFLSMLLGILFIQNCSTTTEPDYNLPVQITRGNDSQFSDSLKTLLKEDAAILALRDLQSDPATKETLVFIPDNLIESYYRGLVHIYNAVVNPQVDLVVNKYKIHTFRSPETHRLIVSVDTSKAWTKVWRNGERLTGNPQVDQLMIQYNLQLSRFHSSFNFVVLYAEEPLNIFALSKKFGVIEGVNFSEPDGIVGDGNNIESKIEKTFISYAFSYGWGDCPAGCISRHYWEFWVMFDGSVKFVKSYGDPL